MDQTLNLDRNSFEQVIAAASLLQQLQRRAKFIGSSTEHDTVGLVDLVNVQQAIQSGALSLDAAIKRIAVLALELTPAEGSGLWLLSGDTLVYRAGAGTASQDELLRNAVVSKLAAIEPLFKLRETDLNHESKVESLLVAPIYRGLAVAGALAVFSGSPSCFSERDQAETRLLAGLITLSLDKAANAIFKHTVTLERAAVLQVIETLVPSLEEMVEREKRGDTKSVPLVDSSESHLDSILAEAMEKSPLFDLPFQEQPAAKTIPQWMPDEEWPSTLDLKFGDEINSIREEEREAADPTTSASTLRNTLLRSHLTFSTLVVALRKFKDQLRLRDGLIFFQRQSHSALHWLIDVRSSVGTRLKTHRPELDRLLSSARVFTRRFGARIAVTTVLVISMAVLVMKAHVPAFRTPAKANRAEAFSKNNKSGIESKNSDGSHRRVTDSSAADALADLSRYEIPNLARQARYGDDSAAFTLGMAYETGLGVPQSCEKAAHWVQEAALGGVAAAEYNLSLRYRDGDGVAVNKEASQKWLLKAASQKYPEAVKKSDEIPSTETRAGYLGQFEKSVKESQEVTKMKSLKPGP